MGKTTIDGLAVRSSNDSKKRVAVAKKSGKVVDMTMSKSGATRTQTNDLYDTNDGWDYDYLMAAQAPARKANTDFLDPVQSFDCDDEEEMDFGESLATNSPADWSDLLGELNKTSDEMMTDFTRSRDVTSSGRWLDDWADADDEYEEEEEKPARRARDRKRRKKFSFGKAFAISLLLIVVVGAGALYMWGDGLISRLTGGKSGLFDTLRSMVSNEIPFETDANGRTNVLVFGTEGYDMDGSTGENSQHDGAQLTDSIMVISLDQETKDVALLSLPRDLKVSMACMAGKINEVFTCNNRNGTDEEAGAQALMKQVGTILGIDFQYYTHVNWASLIDIIDTLGGITVTLDEDINDYYYTGAVAQAGVPIEVNGEQALGLARARHGTMGGDFTRGNSQQKIVEGIVNKVLQSGVGVNEALGLLSILGDNLRTNFSADNIKAGVRLASGFNASSIRQVPLVNYDENTFYVTTAEINEISYVIPSAGEKDYSEIQEYVAGMFSSDGVTREMAGIAVYNSTEAYGVASAEQDELERAGFKVVHIGNAEVGTCDEKYCIYEMSDSKIATRAALEEKYGVAVRPVEMMPEYLYVDGANFVIVIGIVEEVE